ncbi:hypothetical protein J6Z39_02360 [bacterium]|nr:hypothetical protein [bacterium]MBP5434646.1 hypothetical protein [bacterium]
MRRKVRSADLAKRNRNNSHIRYLLLLIAVGGFVLYFMVKWSGNDNYDRFEIARKYSEYYKDFFVETPLNYTIFDNTKLVIRATNLGSKFWNEEFYGMLRQSENEVNEILSVAKLINEAGPNSSETTKTEQNLSSFPVLYDLLETGKKMSSISYYNLAAGEISEFWERQYRNYQKRANAYAKAEMVLNYLFDNPMLSPSEIQNKKKLLASLTREKAESKSTIDELSKEIYSLADKAFASQLKEALSKPSSLLEDEKKALLMNILGHLKNHTTNFSVPKVENAKLFIPYANPDKIELNSEKKSVKILSQNISVDITFFKEALFMKLLQAKLPKENFNYLIFIGDRHGMWHLPKQYIRWSVSIDNPYAVTEKARGAVKLLPEDGYFVITRKNENLLMVRLDDITSQIQSKFNGLADEAEKSKYMMEIKQKYSDTKYFFDPIKKVLFQRFDTPVDWRTASQVENNLAALVIDETDPMRARMLSYSLFISDEEGLKEHEKGFPDTIFAVLKSDDTVFVPQQHKDLFMTVEDIKDAKIKADYKARGLNPDGSIPEKK